MRVFWDTNLFVYLWEKSERTRQVDALLAWQNTAEAELVASTLAFGELLVHPLRKGSDADVQGYLEALSQLTLIDFDVAAAHTFAALRAAHPALRPPDAIHLACASVAQTDFFITNDRRLSRLEVSGVGQIRSLTDGAPSF